MSDHPPWADVLVPQELAAFLAALKLGEHGMKLVHMGYDDVSDSSPAVPVPVKKAPFS